MSKKSWYSIKSQADGKAASVSISGIIGSEGVTAESFKAELDALGKLDSLAIDIHSPGGDVMEGFSIVNALKESGAHITTKTSGLAASMGSVIFCAGDEREMSDPSFLMIHNPHTLAAGDAESFKNTAQTLEAVQASILDIYEKATGLDKETIQSMMDAETYIPASEAVEKGFATHTTENTLKVAAQVSEEWLTLLPDQNFPVELKAQSQTKELDAAPEAEPKQTTGQTQRTKNIQNMSEKIEKPEAPAVNVAEIRAEEKQRTREILAIGEKFEVDETLINNAIDKDISVNSFRAEVMNSLDPASFGVSKEQFSDQSTYIDSPEVSAYSVVKAIREQSEGNLSGLEKEVSEELAARHIAATGQAPTGLLLPGEVTHGSIQNTQTAGTPSEGGYNVATEIKPIVDILNDMLILPQLGATFLRDLTGNCQFPLEASTYTVENLTEIAASTPSDAVFGEATLTPKRAAASTGISKQLLIQSSNDIEAWVRRRIAEEIALKMDSNAIAGDGTGGAPTGILNQAGTTAYAFQVGSSLYANMTAMWADLRGANAAISSAQWLSSPTVTADWMGTPKVAGDGAMCLSGDPVSGFRALNYAYKDHVSIPANEVVFGAWENLIMGGFGGIDLLVDPYSSAKSATVEIVANSFYDVACVRPSAFVVGDDGTVHA